MRYSFLLKRRRTAESEFPCPPVPIVSPHLLNRFPSSHHSLPTTHYPLSPVLCFQTLMSCPSRRIDLQLLCFYGLTNCFSRNSFILIIICVALLYFRRSLQTQRPLRLPVRHAGLSVIIFRRILHNSGAPINTFRINTCKSVSNQTALTSFRMNTYAKRGGGGHPVA